MRLSASSPSVSICVHLWRFSLDRHSTTATPALGNHAMPVRPDAPAPVPDVSPQAIQQRLASGEPMTLLDVREPRERAHCAIAVPPTATNLHIPMREIPAHVDELQEAASRGPLVLYCHHGVRSRNVAEWLAERGLGGLLNLQGGIDAWSIEARSHGPTILLTWRDPP